MPEGKVLVEDEAVVTACPCRSGSPVAAATSVAAFDHRLKSRRISPVRATCVSVRLIVRCFGGDSDGPETRFRFFCSLADA